MIGKRWLIFGGAVLGLFVLVVYVPPYLRERAKRLAAERHHTLMEAIAKGNPGEVEKAAQGFINIYDTDASGESPVSLAEKTGNPRILDALKPLRNPQMDLRRAQNAAETGTSMGLQPPKSEPELNILAIIKDEKDRAATEGRPPPAPEALADLIGQKVDAMAEGERKEQALRNFVSRQVEMRLTDRAAQTALRIKDPKTRVESLVYIVQAAPKGPELEYLYTVGRREIAVLPEPGMRDPLYSQLAHFLKLRGMEEAARSLCLSIQSDEHRNGTCKAYF